MGTSMRKAAAVLWITALLVGCSGLEQSENQKLKRNNQKGEYVYRRSNEFLFLIEIPKHKSREAYPWESSFVGGHRAITKELFHCRGNRNHPAYADPKDSSRGVHFDCAGRQAHVLPLKDGREYIYPVLIDLLNYIQEKTEKKVLITCGFRCPVHNAYADPSPAAQHSKHMMGAEVDFLVEGMEEKPDKVLDYIYQFFRDTPPYRGNKAYAQFRASADGKWQSNKEIAVRIYSRHEGRDFDNRHPYPYLTIQVIFDRDSGEKVHFDSRKALYGYKVCN